jgi:hypothetical protein
MSQLKLDLLRQLVTHFKTRSQDNHVIAEQCEDDDEFEFYDGLRAAWGQAAQDLETILNTTDPVCTTSVATYDPTSNRVEGGGHFGLG